MQRNDVLSYVHVVLLRFFFLLFRSWSQKGRIVTKMRPERMVIEVWPDVAPLAVKNFMALCTGEKGKGEAGIPLHYKVGIGWVGGWV
jgi:hypothetical protein